MQYAHCIMAQRLPASPKEAPGIKLSLWQRDDSKSHKDQENADGQENDRGRPEIDRLLGAVEAAGRAAFVVATTRSQAEAGPKQRGESQDQKKRSHIFERIVSLNPRFAPECSSHAAQIYIEPFLISRSVG
jgi:hypothetical protein